MGGWGWIGGGSRHGQGGGDVDVMERRGKRECERKPPRGRESWKREKKGHLPQPSKIKMYATVCLPPSTVNSLLTI